MPEVISSVPILILTALLAYLIGAVPYGLVMARVFGLGDPRDIGSGSIGATNVLRTGNKRAAALTLLLDAGKGAFAVFVARSLIGEDAAQIAGLAAIIGHMFPVYLRFKGGKGIATAFGMVLVLAYPVGLVLGVIWLVVAVITRYSSLSALVTAGLSPVVAVLIGQAQVASLCVILAILIFERHKSNIRRLMNGEESKIGKKS